MGETTKVTERGKRRVHVISCEVGIEPGDSVERVETEDGVMLTKASTAADAECRVEIRRGGGLRLVSTARGTHDRRTGRDGAKKRRKEAERWGSAKRVDSLPRRQHIFDRAEAGLDVLYAPCRRWRDAVRGGAWRRSRRCGASGKPERRVSPNCDERPIDVVALDEHAMAIYASLAEFYDST
ncbi:hypothetical protein C9J85_07890 [Haloferax sp. wsp5]|nr:hypothetical protein C9J85_07890 [Haloferax sp. wsp5]